MRTQRGPPQAPSDPESTSLTWAQSSRVILIASLSWCYKHMSRGKARLRGATGLAQSLATSRGQTRVSWAAERSRLSCLPGSPSQTLLPSTTRTSGLASPRMSKLKDQDGPANPTASL